MKRSHSSDGRQKRRKQEGDVVVSKGADELEFEDPVTDEEVEEETWEDVEDDGDGIDEDRPTALDDEGVEPLDEVEDKPKTPAIQTLLNPQDGTFERNPKFYEMFHAMQVEWPFLSVDCLMDNQGFNRAKYPLFCHLVGGTQAEKETDCAATLLRVFNLCKTKNDAESDSEDDEEDEESDDGEDDGGDPGMYHYNIPHRGTINRIRSMRQHPHIVAVWGEDRHVSLYNARDYYLQLTDPASYAKERMKAGGASQSQAVKPFWRTGASDHSVEGFGLAWNALQEGCFASADQKGRINVWVKDDQGTSFTGKKLVGHTDTVDYLQWSPSQAGVLASCSVDCTIRVWDTRDKTSEKMQWVADSTDINVISWNSNPGARHLLASGADSGEFKVWDLRRVQQGDGQPLLRFNFHKEPVTSLEWSPINESLLVVGAESRVSFWDMSCERDAEQAQREGTTDTELPPQLIFVHEGQQSLREVHWHPQIPGLVITTDEEGLQLFKPINWKSMVMK
eukprot:TRINITY_DN13343_c1_g1_i1.p1 TRINITY_DN13343_c1_g1~~TRINITY_DN13343_c1_g1_i1.p1  ORF type:complete len:507 (+),score=90.52 TRINITY_DN13343_c1_g1_i1:36-1556(+)